jgi:ferredoxin
MGEHHHHHDHHPSPHQNHHHGHHQVHHHSHGKVYDHLQKRLEANPVAIPTTPLVRQALSLLFSEEEARLDTQMPGDLATLDRLARITGMPRKRLEVMLEKMADRGLVVDFDRNGEKYYMLLPPLPGFLEFSLAKVRDDIPQKKLAGIWQQVRTTEHEVLYSSLFAGSTQFGRVLSYENTLQENIGHRVCSYDKVSEIIEDSGAIGVVLCHCRHERRLNGEEGCSHPMEVCLALGGGADLLLKHNIARRVEKAEAWDILAQTEELGLVHVLDNVQNKPSFMCNCCPCACGILQSFHNKEPFNTVMTSNFIARVDAAACNGCGRCARACPIGAISLDKVWHPEPGLRASVDESICIGCGVCARPCRKDALRLAPRAERVITPETVFHRMAVMALERNKFQDFLFTDPSKMTHRVGKLFVKSVLRLPRVKQALLQKEVNSKFINLVLDAARKSEMGWVLDLL